jgi:hypothetical protein
MNETDVLSKPQGFSPRIVVRLDAFASRTVRGLKAGGFY